MTIQTGTKLGKIINANYGEIYVDDLRRLLRALDQYVAGITIDGIESDPPVSPVNGQTVYVPLTPAATGEFTGREGSFSTWRTGQTTGITNDDVPPYWEQQLPQIGWEFYFNGIFYTVTDTDVGYYVSNNFKYPTNKDERIPVGKIAANFFESNQSGYAAYDNSVQSRFVNMLFGAISKGVRGGQIFSNDAPFGIFSKVVSEYMDVDYDGQKAFNDVISVEWGMNPIHVSQGLSGRQKVEVTAASSIDLADEQSENSSDFVKLNGLTPIDEFECSWLSEFGDEQTSTIIFSGDIGTTLVNSASIILSGSVDYVFASLNSRICLEIRDGISVELWRNDL